MQHTWEVTKLIKTNTNGHENVVVGISWLLTTTDDDISDTVDKQQPITFDENSSFIDYNNLTKEQVLNWLFESMGDRKQMFETQMEININKQRNKQPDTLPWE